MPRYNTTIEDYSPVISYSPNWSAGSSSDNRAELYSDSSFTLTSTDGETASFAFNGTSFQIFGSKRANHGFYQVTVDGTSVSDSGTAPEPGLFQVPLFSSPPLEQKLHVVTLTNQGNSFIDIDFVTFTSSIGTDKDQLTVNTVQDSDSSFFYAGTWGLNPPNIGTYSGGSGHGTATLGAFMTFTFEGDGVTLYGPVGPGSSPFSVSMDGGPPSTHTANKQFYRPRVPLYIASDLGSGSHVVNITYQPTQPGQIFAIDYADVYTTSSGSLHSLNSKASSGSKSGLSGGVIAGIIIALLFVFAILIGLIFFLRRRKRKRTRASLEAPMVPPPMSNRDIIAAPVTYPSAPAQPSIRSYPSTLDGSYYVAPASNIVVDTQAQTYAPSAASESDYSPTGSHSANMRRISSTTHSSAASSSQSFNTLPFPKGTPLPLPPTANQSLAHVPTSELRANRRVVPGRAQDFGSVAGPAPPDYVQATEPFEPRAF
ncbi:hypothetical protein R3P38DRAFT_2840008 [Favolaschia claudopus]|uniref:Transmembrane protein n=1 Tax=Favolaschia claudopus TaxID=2862362 RepID=A0AAW0E0D5_9AGAR